MRYRIHYTLADGSEDSIVVTGDTMEDIRTNAYKELYARGADTETAWSEEVEA